MDRISRCSCRPEGDHVWGPSGFLLFPDDALSDEDLQHALGHFAAECEGLDENKNLQI